MVEAPTAAPYPHHRYQSAATRLAGNFGFLFNQAQKMRLDSQPGQWLGQILLHPHSLGHRAIKIHIPYIANDQHHGTPAQPPPPDP